MRVIFITREGYNLSGARIRCYGFAKELKKYNVEAEVFSFADDLGAKYGEKELQMGLGQKLKYNIRAFKRLNKNINNSVIFMQRLNYHTLAPFLISLRKRNKFIFDCDDWNISENPVYHLGFYPSSKMEYLTRKIAAYSDGCIAASHFLKDYLSKFASRVDYIPTGVDTDIFKPKGNSTDGGRIVFSWIGTGYSPEMGENIRFILDAFSVLAAKFDNIFMDCAGEGRYFDQVKDSLDNFKYKDRVRFSDWISPDRIPDYLAGIDVGLLPLIQDTKFNKAKSPTKLFEYMAMAKPVVATNIGEAGRIIRDEENGFLAKDKNEFINKMEILIKDMGLRQQMGKNAREDVGKKYSLAILGKQLFEALKSINA